MRNLLAALLIAPFSLFGQALITYDTFESGMQGWQTCYPPTHVNSWMLGTSAGNGNSSAGVNSMYITQDGTSCSYGNATATEERIIIWKQFNTVGYTGGFTLAFDWRGYGDYDVDALYIALCFANPTINTNWYIMSSSMALTPNWDDETFIINSPSFMDNNPALKIGFIFKYNNTGIAPPAFAIDNFRLIANQSPLAIDTTATVYNAQFPSIDNPIIDTLDLVGRTTNVNAPGVYYLIRKYGRPQRVIVK